MNDTTSKLIGTVQLLRTIQKTIQLVIPEAISQQLHIIKLENNQLFVALPSAHFSQKLRQHYATIFTALSQQGITVHHIHLKISPSTKKQTLNQQTTRQSEGEIATKGLEAFEHLANSTGHHPELQQAIQRLIQRRRGS